MDSSLVASKRGLFVHAHVAKKFTSLIPGLSILVFSACLALSAFKAPAPTPASLENNDSPLPSTREFKKLIESAGDQSQLSKWKGARFHLVAKVNYSLAGTTVDGVYEVLWAAKDQFRTNLKLGDLAEVAIVNSGKIYHWRTSLAVFLPKMTLDSLVQSPLLIWDDEGISVHKVYSSNSSGQTLVCGEVSDFYMTGEACVDPATNKILSLHVAPKPHKEADIGLGHYLHAEGSSFAITGVVPSAPAWYPARIERKEYDEHLVVNVQTFAEVKSFADGVFTPPKSATSYDWCAEPSYVKRVGFDRAAIPGMAPWEQRVDSSHATYMGPGAMPSVTITEPGELLAYYLIVGPDGKASTVRALRANDPHSQETLDKDFSQIMFPKLACNGKEITREMILYPPITLAPRK